MFGRVCLNDGTEITCKFVTGRNFIGNVVHNYAGWLIVKVGIPKKGGLYVEVGIPKVCFVASKQVIDSYANNDNVVGVCDYWSTTGSRIPTFT